MGQSEGSKASLGTSLGLPLGAGGHPGKVSLSSPGQSSPWLGLLHPGPGEGLGRGARAKSLQMSTISLRAEVSPEGCSRDPERPLAEPGLKGEEEQVASAGHQPPHWLSPSEPWLTETLTLTLTAPAPPEPPDAPSPSAAPADSLLTRAGPRTTPRAAPFRVGPGQSPASASLAGQPGAGHFLESPIPVL